LRALKTVHWALGGFSFRVGFWVSSGSVGYAPILMDIGRNTFISGSKFYNSRGSTSYPMTSCAVLLYLMQLHWKRKWFYAIIVADGGPSMLETLR